MVPDIDGTVAHNENNGVLRQKHICAYLNLTASPSKPSEGAAAVPVVSEKAVSPLKQAERAALVPGVSGQPEAWLQGQFESSYQPMAVSELPKTTRSGRVVKRPLYLKDFQMVSS